MNYFTEPLTKESIYQIQVERLKNIVAYVYKNVPFYKSKFDKIDVLPSDIKTLDDLKLLPFTTKQDLRDNFPYGMFAVPMNEIVRIHASSGTTGTQTVVGYTNNDIKMWSSLIARTLKAYGVTKTDIVQIAYGYGLFTGGLGLHYGVEQLGASVIPISGGNTEKQILTMKNFGVTVLACTPSYALHIYDTMTRLGISPADLKLRIGIFGAEPWSDQMRKNIEEKLKIKAYDIYGLSEVMGPGVSGECFTQDGLHINEDHFLPEIIDTSTLKSVKHGEFGELVFTTLTKEGIPLIRYRTRDITALDYNPCPCNSPFVKMKRIEGRSDDMLIIRGVNVYPMQIENIILDVNEVTPHYTLTIDRKNNLDQLTVSVEMPKALTDYREDHLLSLKKNIHTKIHNLLQVSCNIDLVDPNSFLRSEGKANRIIDKRVI
jgi:phenylacetate-CoA ligase